MDGSGQKGKGCPRKLGWQVPEPLVSASRLELTALAQLLALHTGVHTQVPALQPVTARDSGCFWQGAAAH